MSVLEERAKDAWARWGHWGKTTHCHGCEKNLYCRAIRLHGRWLCLECWDQEVGE